MNVSRISAITGRIVAQFRRDHRTLGLIFVAPILIMAIFGYVFRSQEDTVTAVAVVNLDNPPAGQTPLARSVVEDLRANDNLAVTELALDDAREAVRSGSQRVAVVFNDDFTARMTSERRASLEVIVEGSNPTQASTALSAVAQAIMQAAPNVLRETLPAPIRNAMPSGLPLQIETERLYGSEDIKALDFFAPMFIAYIAFFLVFLLTCVSFLRERTQGTMERLAASPVTRGELVIGYMLGFGLFSVLQALVLLLFTVYALQVRYEGNLFAVVVVTLALVLGAVNLGIFLSTFARNELQAIQFIPIVIIPQVLLSGLLWPVQDMPGWLQPFARAMPLTYAIDALTDIMIRGRTLLDNWLPLLVLLAFAAAAAVLAAGTMRREVA
ncbi:MAG TPA: ABC transporter permease [Chloroflexia bacterium]|nr:ABC transporter permease [Chloroflexia bacterium]